MDDSELVYIWVINFKVHILFFWFFFILPFLHYDIFSSRNKDILSTTVNANFGVLTYPRYTVERINLYCIGTFLHHKDQRLDQQIEI